MGFFWKYDADGNWEDPASWEPQAAPLPGSDVTISTTSTHTIFLSSAASPASLNLAGLAQLQLNAPLIVASFQQEDSSFVRGGALTVTGAASLSGFQLGPATTLLKGPSTISDFLFVADGRVLENENTLTWTGGNIFLSYQDGATGTIQNDEGATFDIQTNSLIVAGTAFTNAGSVIKSENTGTANFVVAFDNTGTVAVERGTLEFDRGGTSSANAFSISSGATLVLHGDNNDRTFTFSGDGAVAGTGLFKVAGGTLELGSGSLSVARFQQTYGTVSGTGTLSIGDMAILSGGLQTGAGTTVVDTAGDISGYVALDGGRRLLNKGTLVWSDGDITLGFNPYTAANSAAGASIENAVGATFAIRSNTSIFSVPSATNTFINKGQLTKYDSVGQSEIGALFTNTGTVSVQTGTLSFSHGGSSSADAFTVADGATLAFNGGLYAIGPGTVNGAGTVKLVRGTLDLGSNNVTFGRFLQEELTGTGEASIISGTGTLTITGPATFTGSGHSEYGSGTTLLTGASTFEGYYGLSIDGGRVLRNQGTATWTNGYMSLGYDPFGPSAGGGTIQNDVGATFAIQCDVAITDSGVGTNKLVNAGTLTKSVTTGTTTIYVNATSTGTVSIASGILDFTGASNIFSGTIGGAGTFELGGGSTFLQGGTVLSVANALIAGNGTMLNLGGSLGYAGRWTQAGGTVAVGANALTLSGTSRLAGAVSGTGRLVIAGGSATITDGNSLGISNWIVSGGMTVVNAVVGYGGTFTHTGGALSIVAGGALALSGATSLGSVGVAGSGATRASLTVTQAVAGAGTVSLNGSATARFGASATGYAVAFAGAGNVLQLGAPGSFGGSITGFAVGDTLDLAQTIKSLTYSSGALLLTLANGVSQTLRLSGTFTGLAATSDGAGGTNVQVATSPYTLTTGYDGVVFLSGTNTVNATTATLNAGDSLIGGAGVDTLALSGGGSFNLATPYAFNGFERITVAAGQNYAITTADANIAAGQNFTVTATSLGAGNALSFNGGAETNGLFVVTGGAGKDTITTGAGDDVLIGGGGNDSLAGGGGNDTASYVQAAAAVVADLTTPSRNAGEAAGDTYVSIENLTGSAFADDLTGNIGANILDGGLGVDMLSGMAGDDIYRVDNAADRVIEAAGGGTDSVLAALSFALAVGQSIESLSTWSSTGTAAINLTGNALVQAITGNAGANTLSDGGAGGADTMSGLGGSDTYLVNNAGDLVVEASNGGTDKVLASVSFALKAGQAIETLSTSSSAGTAAINLTGNTLVQAITGNAGANTLSDGGVGGADTMSGLGGNDTYLLNNAGDIIVEASNSGTDKVLASVSFALKAGQAIETLSTSSSAGTAAINLTGNTLVQAITGNAGANTLSDGGAGGADTMSGLGGNDTYLVNNAGDLVVEASNGGTDKVLASVSFALKAGQAIETLSTSSSAGTAAINLTGNTLVQAMVGNAGSNTIDGKGGNDVLSGLGGRDTFLFSSPLNSTTNKPKITDFSVGSDSIALSRAIFTALTSGTLSNDEFYVGSAAHDATDRIVYNSSTGALFYDSNGNASGGAAQFAQLSGGLTNLAASSFKVVA